MYDLTKFCQDLEDEEEAEDKIEQLDKDATELEDDIKLLAHNVQELIKAKQQNKLNITLFIKKLIFYASRPNLDTAI